jgi:tetratricopeptide (TPR) repeat protein
MLWLLLLALLGQADLYEQGTALLRAGRLDEAERALRQHLKTNPRHFEALANLGALLARKEDFAGALEQYSKALRIAPNVAPLRLNKGLAHFKTRQWAEAVQEFDAFLKAQPGQRQASHLRALALMELERYAEAATAFAALRPADVTVELGLATALLRSGKAAEAQAILTPLLERGDSAEVLLTVGQALMVEDRLDEAQAALEKARRLAPNLPTLGLHLGAIHWRNKRFAEALAEWRDELRRHPDSAEAQFTLGAGLAQSGGDRMEAEQLLRASLRQKARQPKAHYQLGKLLWQARQASAAATSLEQAVALDPSYREAYYLLGSVYRALGETAKANQAFAAVKRLAARELATQQDLFSEQQ